MYKILTYYFTSVKDSTNAVVPVTDFETLLKKYCAARV